jgi:hypothetical protein
MISGFNISENISGDKIKDDIIEKVEKKLSISDKKRFLKYIMKDMKLDVKYEKINNESILFQFNLKNLSQKQLEHINDLLNIISKKVISTNDKRQII